MIFVDFHKAFDSIEWNYLVSCLKAFQFGPDFIRWVKTLYKNIQSCVILIMVLQRIILLWNGV